MKNLIIKLGALGDVVRTTPLLRVLPGETTWVTRAGALPLLPRPSLAAALNLEQAAKLRGAGFDVVLCLDDEPEAAALAGAVKAGRLVGTFPGPGGGLAYTDSAAAWFDLGLISRAGPAEADRRKKANTRSYQELLFAMLGLGFSGEEYLIDLAGHGRRAPGPVLRVGLDERAGERWPMKRWHGYRELAELLRQEGREAVLFRQRERLADFIGDIAACDLVVCGDTLTMHLALALGLPTVALFICTSPAEIYGYGRLFQVVSPLWKEHFYQREYSPEPGRAISVGEVLAQVRRAADGPA